MTNSVCNSGPDSTRRPGPATLRRLRTGTGILCSSHRTCEQVLGSELVRFHAAGRVERRGATGVRRTGFCAVSTSSGEARVNGGRRGVLPCEGCRAARFRRRGRPARFPGAGGRKTRLGSKADPLGFDSYIATVRLGVSWAAWAATRGLGEAARAFPTLWGTSWDNLFWHPHKPMKIQSFAAESC